MDFPQSIDNPQTPPDLEMSATELSSQPSSAVTLTREQAEALGEQIAEQGAHLDAATHRLLSDLRSFDQSRAWARQGASTCAHWLSWRLGWSSSRAREHVRVANCLANLPTIDEALRKGEVSYCKVRAMTRVATPANERLLLQDASHCTGSQLEKICHKYAMVQRGADRGPVDDAKRRQITKRDLEDGMAGIQMIVTPEEAAMIWEVLSKVAGEHSDSGTFSRIDALMEIFEGVARGDKPDRSPIEVLVTVAAEVLDGSDPTAIQVAAMGDGTCVSAETARRLACDCGVVAVNEDEHGTPLSVGRRTRSVGAAIYRALVERDKTCRFPGCSNRQFVHAHHIEHWAKGGETKLANLVTLCGFHHMFVHEYGYRIELDDHQQPHFFDPHGRLVRHVPPTPRPPDLGMRSIQRSNEPLAITPSTNEPLWNGQPPDYDLLIEDLGLADHLS